MVNTTQNPPLYVRSQTEVNFFNGSFVSAQDYADEQQAQFAQRWNITSGFASYGIALNFMPTLAADGKTVQIAPGGAIDRLGRLFGIEELRETSLPDAALGDQALVASYVQTQLPAAQTGQVGTFGITCQTEWITVAETDLALGEKIELARWSPSAATVLDLTYRVACTSKIGAMSVVAQGMTSPVTIAAWGASEAQGLEIDAAQVTLRPPTATAPTAGLSIGASLGVGTMSPAATVDVVTAAAMSKSSGTVTSDGAFLYFSDPNAAAQLAPHFLITVQDAAGRQIRGTVIAAIQGGWEVDTVFDVADAPFWVQLPLALRFGNQIKPYALALDRSGNLGLGTQTPASKLDVSGGLTLASDGARFLSQGTLSIASGGVTELQLICGDTAEQSSVGLTAQAGASLSVWPASDGKEPTLQLTAAGDVGIGTAEPQAKLDVAGKIQSMDGGFVFPDGSVQASAQESVPIGTVIDWWQGSVKIAIPGNFRVCDGSPITGAGAPMDGKNTPDLRDMFIEGTTDIAQTNTQDGSSGAHQHSYYEGAHQHPYPHSHPDISGSVDGTGSATGYWGAPDNNAGAHHGHSVTLSVSAFPPAGGGGDLSGENSDAGTEYHTTSTDTTPPFMSLLKLVRVS